MGKTNVTLANMVSAMVNASNPPSAARALNAQLRGLTAAGLAADEEGGTSPLALVTNLAMNCTDVATAFLSTSAEIERRLYCGYYQSRCGGGRGPQQLTAAYNWKASDGRR
jgi:hypothetical protein